MKLNRTQGEGTPGPKGMKKVDQLPCVVETGYKFIGLALSACLVFRTTIATTDISSKASKPTAAYSVVSNYYLLRSQWCPSLSSRKDALPMATLMWMVMGVHEVLERKFLS